MSDPPRAAAAQMRMQQIRNDIDQGVEEMVENARSVIDWRHYVRSYPWVCLGTAVVIGYLIVPKRSAATYSKATTLGELPRAGQVVMRPAPAALHGVVDALLTTVVSVALRQATTYVGQGVGKLLRNVVESPTRSKGDGMGERACPLR